MLKKFLLTGALFGVSAVSYAGGGDPAYVSEAEGWWNAQAINQQRNLDLHEPIREGSWLGSHNTYNSEVYSDIDSYYDPQQKHSIYDQLRMGARFLELDAHWTAYLHTASPQLLLCHSGIGVDAGDLHLGCSLTDRRLTEGLYEIQNWLKEEKNKDEVILLYIEDHTEGKHDVLYQELNHILGNKIYRSGGCHTVPADLTKADVLAAGKQVLVWKDGACANDANMLNMAYRDLGMRRIWEDGTTIADIASFFTGNGHSHLNAAAVRDAFEQGYNIVNLDDMVPDDGRIDAAIWSWDYPEPNNYNGNEDCVVQRDGGRWNDRNCADSFPYACYNQSSNNWVVTGNGPWVNGPTVCAAHGAGYTFGLPTNAVKNKALDGVSTSWGVWINLNDIDTEGHWVSAGEPQLPIVDVTRNDFKIRVNYANSCLDVEGTNATANGTNVGIYNCNEVTETWLLGEDGKLRTGYNSHLCLDVGGTNTNQTTGDVGIWRCAEVSETWKFLENGEIQARWNSNLCLDVAGYNSSNNGTNVGLYHCGDVEKWHVVPEAVVYEEITNSVDGRCLGAAPTKGAKANVWDCVGNDDQKWSLTPLGYLVTKADPSLCLGLYQAGIGVEANMWTCLGNDDQRWVRDGTLLRNVHNTNVVLKAAGTTNGAKIVGASASSEADRQWLSAN